MGGNWGWVPGDGSNRSARFLVVLLVACIAAGIVLVQVTGQLGDIATGRITGTVIIIVGLLIAGVVSVVRRLL